MVLDTNALVGWWLYWYPPEVHDWWTALDTYAKENPVHVPEEVFVELRRWPDLHSWCDERRDVLVYPNSTQVDNEVRRLANQHVGRLKTGRHIDNADLYVVATGIVEDCQVITDERVARERLDDPSDTLRTAKLKIPDIAKREGVKWARSYEVIRMTGWRFSLADG